MSNGSKNQSKIINRNVIVDYRNGKYQGELSENQRLPDGLGMFLTI